MVSRLLSDGVAWIDSAVDEGPVITVSQKNAETRSVQDVLWAGLATDFNCPESSVLSETSRFSPIAMVVCYDLIPAQALQDSTVPRMAVCEGRNRWDFLVKRVPLLEPWTPMHL